MESKTSDQDHDDVMLDGSDGVAGFLAIHDQKRSSITSSSRKMSSNLSTIIVPNLSFQEQNGKNESSEPMLLFGDGSNHLTSTTTGTFENGGSKKVTQKKELKGWKRYWGLGLGIASSFIFTIAILMVKLLKGNHPFTIALWRFSGIYLLTGPLILHTAMVKKVPIFKPIHPLSEPGKLKIFLFLFLRSSCGCFSAIFHYCSMEFMPMPDSTVIAFSTPVFVTFLAHIFLKEHCGVINVLSAFVTLAGVLVIIRPPFLTGESEMDTNLLYGALLAMGAMTMGSMVYLLLRILKGVNYSVVTFFFGMYGTIECAILAIIFGVFNAPQTATEWIQVAILGVATFGGQVLATLASKYEEAGIVAMTRTFDVMFTFIWQFLFLGLSPTIFSFVGSLIIILGVSLIIIRKYLINLPQGHPAKERLCLLMK